jgi:CoA:oxalate CoA-transferase
MSQYPLAGVKVLDLSRVLAGPFAGRMLSDLGADVVKVEPPDQDVTRHWGRRLGGISGYFHAQNAGKRNISINLKSPDGVALVRALAKQADILIENFRPGVMAKLGVSWEVLHADNPGLIMLSISGFGQSGPEAKRAAYAPIIHAETGSIKRQAEKSQGQPVEMCMSYADTNAGLHGLVGLLAALHQRHTTGLGQHIDIAMIDAMLVTDDQTHAYLENSQVATGASEVWAATGGDVIIAGDFRHLWKSVTHAHGIKDPTPDNATLEEKIRCRRQAFQEFLLSFNNREALIEALDAANLAWGGVFDTDHFLSHSETLKYRNSIAEIDNREGGTRPTFQSPYRFSEAKSGVHRGAARLGEHNQEILAEWLGLSPEQTQDLATKAAIAAETELN